MFQGCLRYYAGLNPKLASPSAPETLCLALLPVSHSTWDCARKKSGGQLGTRTPLEHCSSALGAQPSISYGPQSMDTYPDRSMQVTFKVKYCYAVKHTCCCSMSVTPVKIRSYAKFVFSVSSCLGVGGFWLAENTDDRLLLERHVLHSPPNRYYWA